jgi:hypothetical protein
MEARPSFSDQVTHRPTRSDGENFARKLTGDSHPGGRTNFIEGLASRSPFPDRSTMVIGLGWVAATECEGSAPADSNKFVARATTAIAAQWTGIHLIVRMILDITPTSQPAMVTG